MITKHFFKILGTFIVMIILGMATLFAISYFNTDQKPTSPQVAK